MIRAAGLAALVALAAGCLVPPSETAFGGLATGRGTGYRVSAGAHVAAADRRDRAPVDLGAGWVSEGGLDGAAVHGTYIALARRLVLRPGTALWLGGRAEMFWLVDPGQPRDGVVARIALRRHLGGVGWATGDGKGAVGVFGAAAAAVFVDGGVRELAGGGRETFVSAGVALDLPLVFGVASLR